MVEGTNMTFGNLRNWVWCEDCLEWKDADEVSFVGIKEDAYGKDLLRFLCDKCGNENENNIISSATRPRG
jgi:Zn finger protein HypA/HybF involved in hydrogenase expression